MPDSLDNKSNTYFINTASPEVKARFFDAIKLPIFVVNESGKVIYSNTENAFLHGYELKEFLNIPLENLVSEDHRMKVLKRIKIAISAGETTFESEHIKKDGTKFPIEIHYQLLTIGSEKFLLGTIRDLTNEKNLLTQKDEKINESEDLKKSLLNVLEDMSNEKENIESILEDTKKFKMATDSTSDHIVITDEDGVILYANKAVERITGFKTEEIIGKKAGSGELWGGLMPKEFYATLWDTIKNQKKSFSGDIKNRRKNGEVYDSYATIAPVLDDHGNLKFFIGTERDVTKEKQIDRSKSEFVSLASHQLRTPLTAVRWYTETVMEDMSNMTTEQKDSLREVYAATLRMAELVRSLLNVSRIELSTFSVDPKQILLSELVKDILKELDVKIKKKNINITLDLDSQIDSLNADPAILRILFENLITNAVKYTDAEGFVKIRIYSIDANICFEVEDTGCGIPESQQRKIYSKFFRADNAVSRETDGNGLGLYMVKQIIEKIGGSISYASAENKGTTFKLNIPKAGMKKIEGIKQLDV